MSKQTQQIIADFKAGHAKPIYVVHGEEQLFGNDVAAAAEAHLIDSASKSFNFDVFYGADSSGTDVLSTCLALPMMAARRVVIVHDFELLKIAEPERFEQYVSQPEPNTVLILIAKKLDKRRKYNAALLKSAAVIDAAPLRYERDVSQWIFGKLAATGHKIEAKAVQLLFEHIGTNLKELNTQLDKIITYKGDETHISLDDIELMTGISKEYNSFEMVDAILSGNKTKALKTLSVLLEQGEEPVRIVTALYFSFNKQWQVNQLLAERKPPEAMSKEIKMSPYQAKIFASRGAKLSVPKLSKSLQIIAQIDHELKTSAGRPALGLRFAVQRLLEV